jgi:hypothetical protein
LPCGTPLKFLTTRTYFPIPVYPLRRRTEIRPALDAVFALFFFEKEPFASLLKGGVKGALAGGKKR